MSNVVFGLGKWTFFGAIGDLVGVGNLRYLEESAIKTSNSSGGLAEWCNKIAIDQLDQHHS